MTKRVLAFAFIVASLPFAANAASKNTARIVLDDAVTVGTTEVPKGTYKLSWAGTDPNVLVTFTEGKFSKTFPAHIIEGRNNMEGQTTTLKDNKTILTGLQLHDATLVFTDAAHAGE